MNPLNIYKNLIQNPQTRMIIVVFTLIYLFSPLDILPDVIPIIGQIDDGVLIVLLLGELLKYAPNFLKDKESKKGPNVVDVESK